MFLFLSLHNIHLTPSGQKFLFKTLFKSSLKITILNDLNLDSMWEVLLIAPALMYQSLRNFLINTPFPLTILFTQIVHICGAAPIIHSLSLFFVDDSFLLVRNPSLSSSYLGNLGPLYALGETIMGSIWWFFISFEISNIAVFASLL